MFRAIVFLALLAPLPLMALSDPTRPSAYRAAAPVNPLKLSSILWSEGRKVAIVNGKAVVEGERVSGATVVSIARDKVALRRNGKLIELVPQRKSVKQEK